MTAWRMKPYLCASCVVYPGVDPVYVPFVSGCRSEFLLHTRIERSLSRFRFLALSFGFAVRTTFLIRSITCAGRHDAHTILRIGMTDVLPLAHATAVRCGPRFDTLIYTY